MRGTAARMLDSKDPYSSKAAAAMSAILILLLRLLPTLPPPAAAAAAAGVFLGLDSKPVAVPPTLPNAHMRLFGGAQFHRAMMEFRLAVGAIQAGPWGPRTVLTPLHASHRHSHTTRIPGAVECRGWACGWPRTALHASHRHSHTPSSPATLSPASHHGHTALRPTPHGHFSPAP